MKKTIEIIMKWWAKISSIILIFWMIQLIYLGSQVIIGTGNLPNWPTPILTPILWVLTTLFSVGSIVIFYGPIFYYGWVKNPQNEEIRSWAKLLTIMFPVLAFIGFISPWGLDFPKDILFILPAFALIGPLYYFVWRKK